LGEGDDRTLGDCGVEEERVFFFEKKKQKTFACLLQMVATPAVT
jgi:hypothetical protein